MGGVLGCELLSQQYNNEWSVLFGNEWYSFQPVSLDEGDDDNSARFERRAEERRGENAWLD